MKKSTFFISFLWILVFVCTTSCREEESVFVGDMPEELLVPGSNVANLLFRTTLNDGSADNIIDGASCFSVNLPVTVIVNGMELIIQDEAGINTIEELFEENDDDEDILEIVFPITITFSDYTEETINNQDELATFAATCPEENAEDEDIECVDIVFPVTLSVFNTVMESFDAFMFANDEALNDFIDNLEEEDIVSIEFPVFLVLTDGTELEAMDFAGLEQIISDVQDDCDEDDDNDFNDDDCNDCTLDLLEEVLMSCSNWKVNQFRVNGDNLKNEFDDLSFAFDQDGNVTASSSTETFVGSWSAQGDGNAIFMVLDIPAFAAFNLSWNLNEIMETPGINKIILREGENNILRFQEACANGNGNENTNNEALDVAEVITDGDWQIASFMDGDIDATMDFLDYSFQFNDEDMVIASNGMEVSGTWMLQNNPIGLSLDFGMSQTLDVLNRDWRINVIAEDRIQLVSTSMEESISSSLVLRKR